MIVGLIAHVGKEGAAELVRQVAGELSSRNAPFLMERATAEIAGFDGGLDEPTLAGRCDILMVMGGDGSILRALHRSGGRVRPIFGINIGSLGFLTCLPSSEYVRAVESILSGSYLLSMRSLLEVTIEGASGSTRLEAALNDITVGRGGRSQLVRLQTWVDGVELTEYHADGLIVATPTGSTAYSLAAGGPILMPESGSLVITPICPHVLSNRSVVISDRSEVVVRSSGNHEVFVTVDGREPHVLNAGEHLVLKRSSLSLPLATMPGTPFPEVLRQKLRWSGSAL